LIPLFIAGPVDGAQWPLWGQVVFFVLMVSVVVAEVVRRVRRRHRERDEQRPDVGAASALTEAARRRTAR
jgi:membrane protein implicated in regulation of membrane protease activity